MNHALIIDGEVKATRPDPFIDSSLGEYVEVPDQVECGWRVSGDIFLPPFEGNHSTPATEIAPQTITP